MVDSYGPRLRGWWMRGLLSAAGVAAQSPSPHVPLFMTVQSEMVSGRQSSRRPARTPQFVVVSVTVRCSSCRSGEDAEGSVCRVGLREGVIDLGVSFYWTAVEGGLGRRHLAEPESLSRGRAAPAGEGAGPGLPAPPGPLGAWLPAACCSRWTCPGRSRVSGELSAAPSHPGRRSAVRPVVEQSAGRTARAASFAPRRAVWVRL